MSGKIIIGYHIETNSPPSLQSEMTGRGEVGTFKVNDGYIIGIAISFSTEYLSLGSGPLSHFIVLEHERMNKQYRSVLEPVDIGNEGWKVMEESSPRFYFVTEDE